MTLKISIKDCKRDKIRKSLKDYTYLGCPLTKNNTPWCFRICNLNADGTGLCGRVAPHGFKSRIQQGIEDFKRKQSEPSTLPIYKDPTCNKDC